MIKGYDPAVYFVHTASKLHENRLRVGRNSCLCPYYSMNFISHHYLPIFGFSCTNLVDEFAFVARGSATTPLRVMEQHTCFLSLFFLVHRCQQKSFTILRVLRRLHTADFMQPTPVFHKCYVFTFSSNNKATGHKQLVNTDFYN